MSKIKISVDGACDCDNATIEKNNISVVPFSVLMDGVDKLDGVEVNGQDVVDYVAKTDTLPKTSAPSMEAYEQCFSKYFEEEKCDYVLHFSISNEFSVAYNNASKVAEKFDGKVKVVDTRALSSGICLVMLKCIDLINAGMDIDQVVEQAKQIAKCTQTSFTLEGLRMLHKGGRCSGLSFFMGKTLGIMPSLLVRNGKLGVKKKYLFQKKFDVLVKRYVNDTLKQFPNIDKTRCFITHTPTDQTAIDVAKEIAKQYFDEVIESDAGATICSHCGKNTIGILYVCNEEVK